MKKNKLNMVVTIALCVSLGLSSCIGSFKLTNKVLGWNEGVGNKFVNELVFIAFHIIPVYELTIVADVLVLNSIEFWSGENLVSQSTKEVKGENGDTYLVTVIRLPIKKTIRLSGSYSIAMTTLGLFQPMEKRRSL